MIERTEFLDELKKWKDEKVIKVVTGIRRCGKSVLLKQYENYLKNSGVAEEQIVSVNLEELENEELLDYRKLYSYVKERLQPGRMTYVFLDEIQRAEDFQKAVDSLFVKENVDIYITGSNAYILSGELATLLSGRCIEINLFPFSFKEYCTARGGNDREKLFIDYIRNGSFPYVATLSDPNEKAEAYIEGIYSTIVVKDIEERQKRREKDPEKRKVSDIALLKNISKFLAGSIGSPVSARSIAGYITSGGRRISQNTVGDYLEALIEPYIFYPVERYDVAGKQLLSVNRKMYISDLGIRSYLLSRKNSDLGFLLENVVYFELRRRGFKVNVGKAGDGEIDFVARKNELVEYYQVTASMLEETTFRREMAPFRLIDDNYPKKVLTLDKLTVGNYGGIEVINALDWLLGDALV